MAAVAALLLSVGGSAAVPSMQRPYLALGDSIAFGFVDGAGSDAYANPGNFIGYPAYAGQALGFDVVDAACPGETTSSFISSGAADLGCAAYRRSFALHAGYPGLSQLQFAEAFLTAHPTTQLVTIGLGTNDLQMIESRCGGDDDPCITSALQQVTANLSHIVRSLRAGPFAGALMLVDVYSIDYADPSSTLHAVELDRAIAAAAASSHVPLVDVFSGFSRAAGSRGGHTCATGLLTPSGSPAAPCDIHPSDAGQRLLATLVEQAYRPVS